jgi:hypothetical protein
MTESPGSSGPAAAGPGGHDGVSRRRTWHCGRGRLPGTVTVTPSRLAAGSRAGTGQLPGRRPRRPGRRASDSDRHGASDRVRAAGVAVNRDLTPRRAAAALTGAGHGSMKFRPVLLVVFSHGAATAGPGRGLVTRTLAAAARCGGA